MINSIKTFLKYICSKLTNDKLRVFIIVTAICIHSLLVLLIPLLTLQLIDKILPSRNFLFFSYIILAMIIVPFLDGLFMTYEDYNANLIAHKIVTSIRVNFFIKYLSLKYQIISLDNSGEIIQQIIDEPEKIASFIYYFSIKIILGLISLIALFIVLIRIDFFLSILSILLLFCYLIPLHTFAKKIKNKSNIEMQKRLDSLSTLNETLNAFYLVKIFGLQDQIVDKYKAKSKSYLDAFLSFSQLNRLSDLIICLLKSLSIGIVYLYGGFHVIQGKMTVGILIAAQMYIENIFKTGANLYSNLIKTNAQIPIAEKLRKGELFDGNQEEDEEKQKLENIVSIRFDRISFSYSGKDIITDFTNELSCNKHTAVIGASGCGKSTLLRLLIRLYDVSNGVIYINNNDIKKYSIKELRQEIHLVNQNSEILQRSIWDNITFGLKFIDYKFVEKIIHELQIDKFVNELPDKYATIIGQDGKHGLSGGQIQRIALARAFVQKPQVILLDEATSALDYDNTKRVLNCLNKNLYDHTVISVTHSAVIAEASDEVIYFENSNNVIRSKHYELLKNNENYRLHFR
jgi:ABC-type bacteriocin/lantibiotic exporters, contain an N-terminal double-glycine peptidase domain